MKKTIALVIMDGYGKSDYNNGNAIAMSETPNIDKLQNKYPTTLINASGRRVGLPDGLMGNSEVGHLNIGAGRVVYQDISMIDKAIEDGEFFKNEAFKSAMEGLKEDNALHLVGLLSDGGVHSTIQHLFALMDMAKRKNVQNVYIHAITDGRDVPPDSAVKYIEKVEKPNGEVSKENLCLELDYELSGVNYNIDLFTNIVKDAKQKILEEEDLSKCVDIKNNAISEIKKYSIDSYMHFIIMRSACMPQEDLDKYECLALTYDYVRSMKYYLGKYGDCYFYSTQSYMGFNQSVTDKYNFGNGYVGVYDVKTNKVYGIDKAYEQGIITLDQVKPVYEMYQFFKSLPDVNQGDNDF